jgi:hypothetical protein
VSEDGIQLIRRCAMKLTTRLVQHATVSLCLTAALCLAAQAQELSHVRIVRLGFAEGVVTVHRPDVGEWATASVNTPIQEGFKVATDQGGFAEIEFENASTARIGQETLLEFTQLALLPSGGKVNHMSLEQGYATFNVIPESDDVYEVTVGTATLTAKEKSRFRVDMDGGMLQVKVFKGSVEIMSPEGTGTLGKNAVLDIRPGSDQPFEISQGIKKDNWDEWVEDREERTEMVRNMGVHRALGGFSNNTSDLLWGAMDLMYYGTWISDPSYGYGWVPTVGLGWTPYTQGRWCWYPGMGYTWIGNEPWGWLPYHYGSWMYTSGFGWSWFPTGGFGTWSPASVNWYQGSGWVGWSPRWNGAGDQCPHNAGCVAIASDSSVSGGRTIQPTDLRWGRSFDLGRPVERVGLEPERDAMLTGRSQDPSRGFGRGLAGGDSTGTGRQAGMTVIGGTGGSAPSTGAPGVVYDPASRSYVNNPAAHAAPPTPATPSAPAVSRGFGRDVSSGGSRPGPANNYPAFPVQAGGRQSGASPRGEASTSGSSSDNSDWIRSNAVGWGNGRNNSSSSSDSSASSGGKSDSGSRATSSSSSSATSGGGRSASSNSGGGSGNGSSSGGRSSSGSSGGNSGSFGGGRSSGGGSSGGFGGGGGRSSGGGGGSTGGGGGGRAPR